MLETTMSRGLGELRGWTHHTNPFVPEVHREAHTVSNYENAIRRYFVHEGHVGTFEASPSFR